MIFSFCNHHCLIESGDNTGNEDELVEITEISSEDSWMNDGLYHVQTIALCIVFEPDLQ